jgi:site-specific recombinase XerC
MPVRVLCRHAIERDELLLNPTTNLRLPVANGRRERVASPQEAAELIAALPEEDWALWSTACYAGLRRGELRGLRWDDVDLERNVISVQRGWDEHEGEIEPESSKGRRTVPIAEPLRLVLLEHKARTGRRGSDFVFGRTASLPFTPTHVRKRALRAWAAAAVGAFLRSEGSSLEPIGLRDLRHSYVSLMHDAGFSLERVGDYIGHSSAYMTDRYRHLLDGHETEAADVFSAYLEAQSGSVYRTEERRARRPPELPSPSPGRYLRRLMAAWRAPLFIFERPLMLRRLASLSSCSFVRSGMLTPFRGFALPLPVHARAKPLIDRWRADWRARPGTRIVEPKMTGFPS